MNFEVLNRSHIKRNIIIGIVVVLILSAVVLTFTRAKYRVTQSMPLVSGTINFSPYDFNVVAMYLNKGDETVSTDKAPHVGYTLNSEQSTCAVDDNEVEGYEILYENGLLDFNNLSYAGTKCSVYFDLIPDSENPVINAIDSVSDDTSITVTIDATDNVGIFYYYFQLDDGEEIKSEENTYTFEDLQKDSDHTVNIRVEDAVGNSAFDDKKITVGYKVKYIMLKNYSTILTRTDFNTTVEGTTTGTIYKSLDNSQYDNDGEVYYFAGDPTDNWVKFAGFWWRIIRINGNGSVRMIYQGTSAETSGHGTHINGTNYYKFNDYNYGKDNSYVGYMFQSGQLHGLQQSSTVKETIDSWYVTSGLNNYESYLDDLSGFCGDRTLYSGSGIGTSTTKYLAYKRLYIDKKPSFKCENSQDLYTTNESSVGNKSLLNPVGLITADEASYAGLIYTTSNSIGNYGSYLFTGLSYWTMTPYEYTYGDGAINIYIYSSASYRGDRVYISYGIRPVINLRSDVQLTGSGTTTDPYIVVTS